MGYGYTMTSQGVAVCPLNTDPSWHVCGIDGNCAHFTDGDSEMRVELPFYDRGAVSVVRARIEVAGDYQDAFLLVPDPQGKCLLEVSIQKDSGLWLAVARVVDPAKEPDYTG